MEKIANKNIPRLFALAVSLLALVGGASYVGVRKLVDTSLWVTHTHEVLTALAAIEATVSEAESGQRGYVITGDDGYLASHAEASNALALFLDGLAQDTADNPRQTERLKRLREQINLKMAFIQETIAVRREKGMASAQERVRANHGLALMQNVRDSLNEMSAEERALLAVRATQSHKSARRTTITIVLGTCFCLAILMGAFSMLFRENMARRRFAAGLQESEKRLFQFLEAVPAGIFILDAHGRPYYANHAAKEMLGMGELVDTPAERITETYKTVKAGTDALYPADQTPIVKALKGFRSTATDLEIVREDRRIPLFVTATPIFDRAGGVAYAIAAFVDMTERKQLDEDLRKAKEEAEAASRAKGDFLASMSHEIRTPLNAIIGVADVLADAPMAGEQKEYVELLRRSGDVLLNLINDILDLSKIEAGRLELESEPFDLREVVEPTAEMMALRAHKKGLELLCHVAPDIPSVLVGDPNRLRQVIVNLLGNALKFTERGHILIRVEKDRMRSAPGALIFSVSDTGIGIPADKLAAVFQSFTQADSSTTRKYGGTGLGLTISKRLVEAMGGRIWVESAEGEGSTFLFTVALETRDGTPKNETPLKGRRLLAVDDHPANRQILADLVRSAGAEVAVAASGYEALSSVQEAAEKNMPFDAVLLDLQMPDMDGLQTAEKIRALPALPKTALLLLTSDTRGDTAAKAQALGFSAVLAKPVRQRRLLNAVQEALSPTAATPGPASPEARPSGRACRILLVDDSVDNRKLVLSFFRSFPFQWDTADNGADAVERFKKQHYDLILMDVQMPVMDGYSATRAIRAWEKQEGKTATPILALTAHALVEDAKKSLEAGCDAHITKPIKKTVLLETVQRFTGAQAPTPAAETVVHIDPDIQALALEYLKNMRKHLDTLNAALAAKDFERIKSLGHRMKGDGGTYGFDGISDIGRLLEKAGAEKNEGLIAPALQDLTRYLDQVRLVDDDKPA